MLRAFGANVAITSLHHLLCGKAQHPTHTQLISTVIPLMGCGWPLGLTTSLFIH